MEYEESEIGFTVTGADCKDEEMDCLSEAELERLQFFAEHPDLADPLIWFLPGIELGRRGSSKWGEPAG